MMTRKNTLMLAAAIAIAASSFAAGAYANQPRMVSALRFLQDARAELNAAQTNKGGHRERAIELVNAAIRQVNEGIAYGGN